ncbi:MAG: LacI family DNA-binding transcriptional regulator [Pseudomonadota bacterium]
MSDVARVAGVSPMTVSRALRKDSPVSRRTREHVLKVVKELGYVPDQIASGLASQRSGFVTVMVPSLNNPHFADTVASLSNVVIQSGLQVLIGHTEYKPEQEQQLLAAMLRRRPEAIVLCYDGHTPETLKMVEAAGIPVIEIWETPRRPIEHVVGFSNKNAARTLTEKLIERGFSRFVFLGESDDKGTRGSERRKGFRAAMKVAGLPDDRLLDIAPPPVSMPQGARALPEILQRWPDTDIIFCVSDPCAFGVLTESQRRGISVPGELAIAGFGEFEVSGLAVPSITTVAVDAHAIGRNAGELILEIRAAEMRGGRLAPQRIEIHTAPVLREST